MTRVLYAAAAINLAELRKNFPSQFRDEAIGWSWPDGWHGIVARACEQARRNYPDLHWDQIKEKYGVLAMYYSGGSISRDHSDLLRGHAVSIIKVASEESSRTCMSCAAPAEHVVIQDWYYTLCPECQARIEGAHEDRH